MHLTLVETISALSAEYLSTEQALQREPASSHAGRIKLHAEAALVARTLNSIVASEVWANEARRQDALLRKEVAQIASERAVQPLKTLAPESEWPSVVDVNSAAALRDFMRRFWVAADWHEPDEQSMSAVVLGATLDNAGYPASPDGADYQDELTVYVLHDGKALFRVEVATLLALAAGTFEFGHVQTPSEEDVERDIVKRARVLTAMATT